MQQSLDIFLNYLDRSNAITIIVLAWLSIYFIITVWIYVARYFVLRSEISLEAASLEALLMGSKSVASGSYLEGCSNNNVRSDDILYMCKEIAESESTRYLSTLSVIASTSPFIGLFGTVVSILVTFSELGNSTTASLNVIAPAISEALIATAAGILVAIPAYSAHVFLKRKAYELVSYIEQQIKVLKSY